MKTLLLVAACALTLVGCGESPQPHALGKNDTAPYKGTGKPYVEKGWTQGDKASWESALKVRTQQGQNDYSRLN